ncbi:MAG: hypothetical protein ABH835_04550 [Patescibacteria group bacterium]
MVDYNDQPKSRGRKAAVITWPDTGTEFTVKDLAKLSNISISTANARIQTEIKGNKIKLARSEKTGGRGKPFNIYTSV